ncbi:MAG: amidohydrolase [Spirochaetia bacterium]|nr:amidohydrolase [Spirochaetia bacterium]MCF7953807.1 amidohydrolase [Spirochaetales bacterium]
MKAPKSQFFFDTHFHAMNLHHPNFISFINEMQSNFTTELLSGMYSLNYLFSNKNTNIITRLQNMLSVLERPISDIFLLMEKDLSGGFEHRVKIGEPAPSIEVHPESGTYAEKKAYFQDDAFIFRSNSYNRVIISPMVMDFSRNKDAWDSIYYPADLDGIIYRYIEDTITGIHGYYQKSSTRRFRIWPFLGVHPKFHSMDTIQNLLETYMVTSPRGSWNPDTLPEANDKKLFRGIKFYPPLGLDPWPEGNGKAIVEEKEKLQYIYNFCEKHNLPITTHCDDQGFRTIPTQDAWTFSSPLHWQQVLEHYPNLYLDFAHFGMQYNLSARIQLSLRNNKTWYWQIINLMNRYPRVYADVSFTGGESSFYKRLADTLKNLPQDKADRVRRRLMFGSDFMVNLTKVNSYKEYYHILEESDLTDAEVHAMVSENPAEFMC